MSHTCPTHVPSCPRPKLVPMYKDSDELLSSKHSIPLMVIEITHSKHTYARHNCV